MEQRSPRVQHTETKNNFVPTDSMVTVALSETSPDELRDEPRDEPVDETVASSAAVESLPPSPEEMEQPLPPPTQEETDALADVGDETLNSARYRPESIVSIPQNCDDDAKSLHSASGSDCVDWDELDKTEEQEPRSEATDEVSSKKYTIELGGRR
jgi:hypothetical protein